MCDWPRLFSCPGRPHLFARCRAHKVHFLDGNRGYPKLIFTVDLFCATGHPSAYCRRISSDSHTIYGQRLHDWDCSFVDSDRFAIAYRDGYFGVKTLCLLLYDISRRQFRTCNLTAKDYLNEEEDGYGLLDFGMFEARATAEEAMADYMLKQDLLLIISPPNNSVDYRLLTSYRLSWPLETSLTLTPLWEPKPELRMRIRPPGDFSRRRFCAQASFLDDDDVLRVFDGQGTIPSTLTVTYDRFFSIDLKNIGGSGVHDAIWSRCLPDFSTNSFPRFSTVVNMKHIAYCTWRSTLYMWNSPTMWNLKRVEPAAGLVDVVDSDNVSNFFGDWQWSACSFGSVAHDRTSRLSWPQPSTMAFAVNGCGGVYELDNNDIEDGGAPRFIGCLGTPAGPPPLSYLAAVAVTDSWDADALEGFFGKSVCNLRRCEYPFCLARLAFLKS